MNITHRPTLNYNEKCIIIPIMKGGKTEKTLPSEVKEWLGNRVTNEDFASKSGETIVYFKNGQKTSRIIFVGCGTAKKNKENEVRNIIAAAIKQAAHLEQGELTILIGDNLKPYTRQIGEAIILTNYNPAKYKTGKEKDEAEKKKIKKLCFVSDALSVKEKKLVEEGIMIAEEVNKVRDMINAPHNLINSQTMAQIAKRDAFKSGCRVTVFDKKRLEKMKMGAFLGVNKGSEYEAKMVVMEYMPKGSKSKPIVLVGKGVTYDTGGINLKPSQGLEWMHMDCAGAVVVYGVMNLLKKLGIKKNVVGIFPLTDNAVDAKSQKPNDVVTAYSGKTIEIGNTDAEGRLVLADAINYAVDRYDPKEIIDLATLTGACMVALGETYAGLFTNNKDLREKLLKAGEEVDEKLWHMPVDPSHHKMMKSKIADLTNSNGSGLAGASTGAAFIEEFVDKKPWVHLDIAGVTNVKQPKKYDTYGATGWGVRLLIKYLEG